MLLYRSHHLLLLYLTITHQLLSAWTLLNQKRSGVGLLECRGKGVRVEVGGGASLTLTSPNYPAAYDYYADCGWIFMPTSRSVVLRLRCDMFDLQPARGYGKCPDYLKVHNTKYCGSQIPRTFKMVNASRWRISFHSNGKNNYLGFRCVLTAVNTNTKRCACGGGGDDGIGVRVGGGGVPWLTALVPVNTAITEAFCTAAVVSERFIITSASCAARIKYNKYNYEVVIGSEPSQESRWAIRKVFLHPSYVPDMAHSEGNLALIHLKEAIKFKRKKKDGQVKIHKQIGSEDDDKSDDDDDDDVVPVCLPHPDDSFYNQAVVFNGLGRTESGEAGSLQVKTISWGSCTERYDGRGVSMSPAWLCAEPTPAHHRPGATTNTQTQYAFCQSELGGPLVGDRGGAGWVLAGVAAYSDGGCYHQHKDNNNTLPLVFTNLSRYLGWIQRTLGQDGTCQP